MGAKEASFLLLLLAFVGAYGLRSGELTADGLVDLINKSNLTFKVSFLGIVLEGLNGIKCLSKCGMKTSLNMYDKPENEGFKMWLIFKKK